MLRFLEVHCINTCYLHEVIVPVRLGETINRSLSNIVAQNGEVWNALSMHNLQPSLFDFSRQAVFS